MKKIIPLFATGVAAMTIATGCFPDTYVGDGVYFKGGSDWAAPYGDKYEDYGENPFFEVSDNPVSTFAVACDGASYSNMRRWLNGFRNPPTSSVRVEEFINYFKFDYPEPTDGHNVSIDTEVVPCPWNAEHQLLRNPATNYVFLIDVSGSMSGYDRLVMLQEGFLSLVDVLGAQDKVAIVTYAGNVAVTLPSTSCDEKTKIRNAIKSLVAYGSTAGGQAIKKAYEIAVQNYIPGGNNRIIVGTDGDFNVGASSDDELVELIKGERDKGVYITVLGVGRGNLNDSMMEKVANNGNGNYEYLDNVDQLRKVFINEHSKFYAVAKDCKIQVDFTGTKVDKYRLIGYENRVMDAEDFEDDTKDGGDIGAGQTVTALYEIATTDAAVGLPYASLEVRYKKPGEENSLVLEKTVPEIVTIPASPETSFAAGVAAFGMLLKESEYAGTADRAMILSLCSPNLGLDPYGYRAEFLDLVELADL